MVRSCMVSLAVAAALSGLGEGLGENTPRKAWTCTKAATELLAKWAKEGEGYRARTDHIGMFARGQLQYGGNRSDYIHNWFERPLLQDTSWQAADKPDVMINPLAWRTVAETVHMAKMDGLAACPTQVGRHWIIPRSVEPGGEMTVFLELPYGYHDGNLDKYLATAEKAFAMPNAYKIDGKIVLTRYPEVHEDELEKAEAFRKKLEERFGPDKFIVLYYVFAFEKRLPDGPLTPECLEEAREHLRRVLRRTDGIFYAGVESFWTRRFNSAFANNVVVPMIRAVLNEPEFRGRKYLGASFGPGHCNCYRWSYLLDTNGTQMLTGVLEMMGRLRPDFILGCEWDELNENTYLFPTVGNGYTNMRIVRHFVDRFAGREPSPWPLDVDTSLPNVVLSYRKSLIAGEPIEAEVLNIPDGTFRGKSISVALSWKNAAGRIVKTYAPQRLAADDLAVVRFVSPASELAAERTVVPVLSVTSAKGTVTLSDGFWPLDIHATRQVDFWWVKTPVRELARGVEGALSCAAADASGAFTVSGHVRSPVRLKSVEVMEGSDTVYMADPAGDVPDRECFAIDIQAFACAGATMKMNGSIRVENASDAILSKPWRYVEPTGNAWVFKDAPLWNWPWVMYLEIPSADVGDAALAIDLPGAFRGRVKLRNVMAKDVVGIPGPGGGNLVIRRMLATRKIPCHLDAVSREFSFRMKPAHDLSVLRIRTVDEGNRVWYSKPFEFFRRPTGRKVSFNVVERDEERVTRLTLDSSLVPSEIRYDFSPGRGSVIPAVGLGPDFWGVLGGFVPQLTGVGRAGSNYGNCVANYVKATTPGWQDSAPVRTEEPDGTWSLAFGNVRLASFPKQILPTYAGWELEMEVWPETAKGRQTLYDFGFEGFSLFLSDCVPTARYFRSCGYARQDAGPAVVKGPKLVTEKWNRIKVSYDGRQLAISTDGRGGERAAFCDYLHEQRFGALGAANRSGDFFRGKIRNFAIRLK